MVVIAADRIKAARWLTVPSSRIVHDVQQPFAAITNYAAHLARDGHRVSLIARGERAAAQLCGEAALVAERFARDVRLVECGDLASGHDVDRPEDLL